MNHAIIDRGRGPEIAGSRITVYDVLAETQAGATAHELARWYELDVAQIELALRYIDEHRDEVLRDYNVIKARHSKGNSPIVRAKLEASRAKFAALKARLMSNGRSQENGDARPPG